MRMEFTPKILLPLLFLSITALTGRTQNTPFQKADRLFNQSAYTKAIPQYKKALAANEDIQARARLGDAYRMTGNSANAAEQYQTSIRLGNSDPQVHFYLGYVLKMMGKYEEAKTAFTRYAEKGGNPAVANKQIASCDFAVTLGKRAAYYTLAPLEIAEKDAKRSRLKIACKYKKDPFVQPNDSVVFLTHARTSKGEITQFAHSDIYTARKKGKRWKVAGPLPFANDGASYAHPAVSKNGKQMVFSSDRSGGQGGYDLYLSKFEKGRWNQPVNLGPNVNSPGNESHPYWFDEGTLLFASDGHLGMGGLDLYATTRMDDGWTPPQNLSTPLNSSFDDWGINWSGKEATGYFTTNRSGSAKMLTFRRKIPVTIIVLDAHSRKFIEDAEVEIEDAAGQEWEVETNDEGQAYWLGEWKKDYRLTVTMDKYETKQAVLSIQTTTPLEPKNIVLEITRKLAVSGIVTDSLTGQALPNARILLEYDGKETVLQTDAKGYFEHPLTGSTDYSLTVLHSDYVPVWRGFSTQVSKQAFDFSLRMMPGKGYLVVGKVMGKKSGNVLSEAEVRAQDWNSGAIWGRVQTDAQGRFGVGLPVSSQHSLLASKSNYFSARLDVSDAVPADTTVNVELALVEYKAGELVKTIYHNYKQADLQQVGARELDEIAYFLQANPSVVVSVESHTDSRGGDGYNLELSRLRAKVAYDYLLAKGVSTNSLRSLGRGEAYLINGCTNDVPCTEDQHARNRRTMVWVIAVGN